MQGLTISNSRNNGLKVDEDESDSKDYGAWSNEEDDDDSEEGENEGSVKEDTENNLLKKPDSEGLY